MFSFARRGSSLLFAIALASLAAGCPLTGEVRLATGALTTPVESATDLNADNPPYVVVSYDGNHQAPTFGGCETGADHADCDENTIAMCSDGMWIEQRPDERACPTCYAVDTAPTCEAARERFPSFLADLAATGCQNACTADSDCGMFEMRGTSGHVLVSLNPFVDEEFPIIGAFFDNEHSMACSDTLATRTSGPHDFLQVASVLDGETTGDFDPVMIQLFAPRCEQNRCVLYPNSPGR